MGDLSPPSKDNIAFERLAFKTYWKLSDYPVVVPPSLLSSHNHGYEKVEQPCTEVYTGRFTATEERVEYHSVFCSVMITIK